jgi:hypothetical protein
MAELDLPAVPFAELRREADEGSSAGPNRMNSAGGNPAIQAPVGPSRR